MNRRGFALLAVLWTLAALSVLVAAGMIEARLGHGITRNRVWLARAEWAREACGEILLARYAADSTTRRLETIDLGRGTWCRATLEDPTGKLNLNTVPGDLLLRLFKVMGFPRTLADSIHAQRRRGTIYHLRQVPGVDSIDAKRLAPFVTTRGPGSINVNAAPFEVLMLLPGMTADGALMVVNRRAERPFGSGDELLAQLFASDRALLLERYVEFTRLVTFDSPQVIVLLEGGVQNTPIVARATLTAIPVPGRLAIVRRETE
jgi:type II secretory pathway component PulK